MALMGFLADAHRRGVLRQAGAVYQFRHIELQHRLANRDANEQQANSQRLKDAQAKCLLLPRDADEHMPVAMPEPLRSPAAQAARERRLPGTRPSGAALPRSTPGSPSGSAPAVRHSIAAWRASGSSNSPSLVPSKIPATSARRSARPAASSRSAVPGPDLRQSVVVATQSLCLPEGVGDGPAVAG